MRLVQAECEIYALKIRAWPVVATTTTEDTPHDRGRGIKIFNMETEMLLRHIICDYTTYVNFYDNILMACGNFDDYHSWPSLSIRFWNMSDLMDMSKSIEDVGYRDISPISSPDVPHCTIVMIGSNVLSTEGTHFVQRSFWP